LKDGKVNLGWRKVNRRSQGSRHALPALKTKSQYRKITKVTKTEKSHAKQTSSVAKAMADKSPAFPPLASSTRDAKAQRENGF